MVFLRKTECSSGLVTGSCRSYKCAPALCTLDGTVLVEGELNLFFSFSRFVPALLPHPLSSALFQIMLHNVAVHLTFPCFITKSHSHKFCDLYIPEDNNIKQSGRKKWINVICLVNDILAEWDALDLAFLLPHRGETKLIHHFA